MQWAKIPNVNFHMLCHTKWSIRLLKGHEKFVEFRSNMVYTAGSICNSCSAHRSIWSQPPSGPGLPTIAIAHTAAYVGRRWGDCPGPPEKPPLGCWQASMWLIALHFIIKSKVLKGTLYALPPLSISRIKSSLKDTEWLQSPEQKPGLTRILGHISCRKTL